MADLVSVLARELARGGVRQAFGVVGAGNFLAVAALIRHGVDYVAARHEGGAMAMADAYHRATAEVAVCATTHGAGLANTATALTEAVKHRSSVIVICGDAPTDGPRPFDLDTARFAAAVGARTVRVTAEEPVRRTAARALSLARDGDGPVMLCLPADLAAVPASPDEETTVATEPAADLARQPELHTLARQPELHTVVGMLAAARRPLILAGLGAWRSGAGKVVQDLAARVGGLLTTTAMANGLFGDSRWSIGICGGFSSPVAAKLIGEADLVLVFGASLDVLTLHGGRLIDPAATVVRVDSGPRRPAPRVDLEIEADATDAATALLDAVDAAGLTRSGWRDSAEPELGGLGWAREPFTDASTADRIDPRRLTIELAGMLPEERTVVLDGGHFVAWPFMYWPMPDPAATIFIGSAFQTIGLGFAGAVGAAAGRADRLTVVALGDGGALMGLPDLESMVRTGRSALAVVYDDAAYGFEVHRYGGGAGAAAETIEFADTDFAGVAAAFGARVATVRTAADLSVVREWCAEGMPGTLVLDCKVVRDVVAPFLAELRADADRQARRRRTPGTKR